MISNHAKIFVGLDPGITTGYAIVDEGCTLIESGNLLREDLMGSVLADIVCHPHATIIIEDTPIPTRSAMNKELQEIVGDLTRLFPIRVTIAPGVWKQPAIEALRFPIGSFPKPTPHQRDAYHLVVYYLMKEKIWTTETLSKR
jgi:hypothetical protein